MNDDANENNANNYNLDNSKTVAGKSFEYKTNIIQQIIITDSKITKYI